MSAEMGDTKREGFGDRWRGKEEEELICISLNVNSLRHEKWKMKNDCIRDLLLTYKVDLITLQEINLNCSYITPKE